MKPKQEPTIPLFVDSRVGSRELLEGLRDLGMPAELTLLPFGDFAFYPLNRGSVVIERKTVSDAVSCFYSGRLVNHQLPGMRQSFEHVFLVVEGPYRADDDGGLEIGYGWPRAGRSMPYLTFEHWLTTLEQQANVHLRRSLSTRDTRNVIHSLYTWFRSPDEHRSEQPRKVYKADLVHAMALQLPGVGYERAQAVSQAFPHVQAMVGADAAAWQAVPGFGEKLAHTITTLERWKA